MDRVRRPLKAMNKNPSIYLDLENIIRENALRFLPAKSLLKFTSVCRDWKLMISSPFFAHNQSVSFSGFSGFFCQIPDAPPTFVPLDSNAHGFPDPSLSFLPEPVVVRCSSHGLVCCQDRSGAYYICNPMTKQWKKLPQPNANHGVDPAIVLIFEPSLLSFESEYKLVCAFKSSDFEGMEFEIFSSTKGSWRVSGEICFGKRELLPRSGVYADGVVYWATAARAIFGFDLTKERSIIMSGKYSLGALNGKLCSFLFQSNELIIEVLSNPHTNTTGRGNRDPAWRKIRQIYLDGSTSSAETAAGNSEKGHKPSVFVTDMAWSRDRYGLNRDSVLFANNEMVVRQSDTKVTAIDLKTHSTAVLLSAENGFGRDMIFVPYVNSLINL